MTMASVNCPVKLCQNPKQTPRNDCDPARWDIPFEPKLTAKEDMTWLNSMEEVNKHIEQMEKKFYQWWDNGTMKTDSNGDPKYMKAWRDEGTREAESERIRDLKTGQYETFQDAKNRRQDEIDAMYLAHEPYQFICNPQLIDDAMQSVLGVNPQLSSM